MNEDDISSTPGPEMLPGFNQESFMEVPAGFFADLSPVEKAAKQQLYTLAWERARETMRQRRDHQWMVHMGLMDGEGI